MPKPCRLAFMFDAPRGDRGSLEGNLERSSEHNRLGTGEAQMRLDIADRHPGLVILYQREQSRLRTVDDAVDATISSARVGELPHIAGAMREVLDDIAEPASIEVLEGRVFPIVPSPAGGALLSLAFKRDSGTTAEELRAWWLCHHSGIATSALGPDLLAYDQIHVDAAVTEAVAGALGVEPAAYDAYDNLTWGDRDAFLRSVSDAEAMASVFADEVGRIDDSTRRNALIRQI